MRRTNFGPEIFEFTRFDRVQHFMVAVCSHTVNWRKVNESVLLFVDHQNYSSVNVLIVVYVSMSIFSMTEMGCYNINRES